MVMNTGSLISLIPIVLFFGFICGLGIYFILKRLKGDLSIIVPKSSYEPEDIISGQVKLKAKKPIDSNKLTISLIKEEFVNRGKHGSWEERYKIEEILERRRKYGRNYSNYYDFSIKIDKFHVNNLKPKSFLGITWSRQIRWKLYARVDAIGIDLTSQKIIKINKPNNSLERKY